MVVIFGRVPAKGTTNRTALPTKGTRNQGLLPGGTCPCRQRMHPLSRVAASHQALPIPKPPDVAKRPLRPQPVFETGKLKRPRDVRKDARFDGRCACCCCGWWCRSIIQPNLSRTSAGCCCCWWWGVGGWSGPPPALMCPALPNANRPSHRGDKTQRRTGYVHNQECVPSESCMRL